MVLIYAKITQDVAMTDGPMDKKCPRESRSGTNAPPSVDVSCEPSTGLSVGALEIKPLISAISRLRSEIMNEHVCEKCSVYFRIRSADTIWHTRT